MVNTNNNTIKRKIEETFFSFDSALSLTHSNFPRKMMQTAIVTYPDEHQVIQPVCIPMPPSTKVIKMFQSNTPLYLYSKETGLKYCWKKDGSILMYNIHNGIVYEWLPKPTYRDAILKQATGQTTIFKKDGTVTQTIRLYPNTQRWTLIWPASPSICNVDGVETEDFTDSIYYVDDESDDDEEWFRHYDE